jgi:CRP/FNR family transcriptional regulator
VPDSIGSHTTGRSQRIEHSAYLPPFSVPIGTPGLGAMFRHACQLREGACLHCPVQNLSICDVLENSELAALSNLKHTVHYKHKATLIDQDKPAVSVHIVTEGAVRLCKSSPDGQRQVIGFALPGDLLGHAIDNHSAYSAEALGNVVTCKFSRKAFGELLNAMPHLMRHMHGVVVRELGIAQDHMMLLARYSAKQKLAAFILQMRNRWRRVNGSSAHVGLPMPRQDIADYLGLTIETVSRTMSLLVRQKIVVVVPDGVRIPDMERLARVAGE